MGLVTLPGGGAIWCKETGSGKRLLQIHGSAFGHRNFEKLTPCLARDFQTVDIDLPGYGESRGDIPRDMEGFADLVAAFIVASGFGRVHVHGTSFGAMIALTLAARRPDTVDRLILSCFLARYDNAARLMRATWKRAARDSGMEAVADLTSVAGFARGFYDSSGAEVQLASMRDAFAHTTPAAFIAGTETIERTDLSMYAPQVRARTLLLAGAEDNMTPFKPAPSGVGFSRVETMIPDAHLKVLPDCGHYLVIEQPEAAAEHIGAFLRQP